LLKKNIIAQVEIPKRWKKSYYLQNLEILDFEPTSSNGELKKR
jgi:hypothetical protein